MYCCAVTDIGLHVECSSHANALAHLHLQVFCAWRQVVGKRRRNRDVLKAALGRLCNQNIAAAFSSWKGCIRQRISHRSILNHLLQRRKHCTTCDAFVAWREAAQRSGLHQQLLKVNLSYME